MLYVIIIHCYSLTLTDELAIFYSPEGTYWFVFKNMVLHVYRLHCMVRLIINFLCQTFGTEE